MQAYEFKDWVHRNEKKGIFVGIITLNEVEWNELYCEMFTEHICGGSDVEFTYLGVRVIKKTSHTVEDRLNVLENKVYKLERR